jgi:hypothetical protein
MAATATSRSPAVATSRAGKRSVRNPGDAGIALLQPPVTCLHRGCNASLWGPQCRDCRFHQQYRHRSTKLAVSAFRMAIISTHILPSSEACERAKLIGDAATSNIPFVSSEYSHVQYWRCGRGTGLGPLVGHKAAWADLQMPTEDGSDWRAAPECSERPLQARGPG